MEQFLLPESLIGLNIFKERINIMLNEKSRLEDYIQNLNESIKSANNRLEILEVGNSKVHQEFTRFTNQNHLYSAQSKKNTNEIENLQKLIKED